MFRTSRRQQGFSLLEALLVVGLLSGLMVILTSYLEDYMRREQMRAAAEYMQLVQKAVEESVNTIEKFDRLYAIVDATPNNVAEIPILTAANANRTYNIVAIPVGGSLEGGIGVAPNRIDPSTIVNAGFDGAAANSLFRDTLPVRASSYTPGVAGPGANPSQQARLTILARIADNAAIVNDARALEIMIVSVDRIAERDMRGIAQEIDVHGGIISARSGAADATIARSVYGDWQTRLVGFTGTSWFTRAALRPATLADGGYLASYTYLNEALMAGDYLYRTEVAGNPSLNRMNTPLNLGGNNIIGADNVEISRNLGETNNPVTSIFAQGSMFVDNDMQIYGDLVVEDDVAAGNMTVARSYAPPAGGFANPNYTFGNITVKNNITTTNLTTTNNLSATSARLRSMNAPRVSAENLNVNTTLSVTGAEGLYARTLTAREARLADTQAGNLNVRSTTSAGSIGVVEGRVGGSLVTDSNDFDPAVNTLGVHNFSTRGALTIHNVTRCQVGC